MRVLVLAAATALALGAPTLSAQSDSSGTRVHVGLGLGWSVSGVAPTDPNGGPVIPTAKESRSLGGSAAVGVTTRLTTHWALGAELAGWTGNTNEPVWTESRRTQLGVHAVGLGYPFRGRGLYFKAGVGIGGVIVDSDDDDEDSGIGLGYVIGLGYEFPRWGRVVISPHLDARFVQRFGSGVPNVVQVGVVLRPG